MTTSERIAAVIVNAAFAYGIGHYVLHAPWWAAVMWFSLENGVVSLRGRK